MRVFQTTLFILSVLAGVAAARAGDTCIVKTGGGPNEVSPSFACTRMEDISATLLTTQDNRLRIKQMAEAGYIVQSVKKESYWADGSIDGKAYDVTTFTRQ